MSEAIRMAVIEGGIITNIIMAGEGYEPPVGEVAAVDDTVAAGIGWGYDGKAFTPPHPVGGTPEQQNPVGGTPEQQNPVGGTPEADEGALPLPALSPRRFWQAALVLGITEEGLLASIANPDDALYIEDEGERAAVRIDIRKASFFERDHPLIEQLAQARDIPLEQLDDLWRWAAHPVGASQSNKQ